MTRAAVISGWREHGRMSAIVAAACVAAAVLAGLTENSLAVPVLYIVPVVLAAFLLTLLETSIVAVVTFALFVVALALNRSNVLGPGVVLLGACGALVVALSARYRQLKEAEEREAAAAAEAGALGVVASGLASTLDLDQLLGMIAAQLSSSVGVGRCSIMLLEGDLLRLAATTDAPLAASTPGVPAPSFACSEQLLSLTGPSVVSAQDDSPDAGIVRRFGARSALILPLLTQSELLGLAFLDDVNRDSEFGERQMSVGMTIASFAALTVNNARFYKRQTELSRQLAARSRQLEALLRLGNELRASFDLDQVLQGVGQAVVSALSYRECAIYLYEKASDLMITQVSIGGSDEVNEAYLSQPIPRRIFDNFLCDEFRLGNSYFRSQQRAPGTEEEWKYFPATDLGHREPDEWQTADSLFVPLLSRENELLGILDVYDPVDRRLPTLESVRLVEIFANQAAIAIENAQQYCEIQSQRRQLEWQVNSQRDLLKVSESMLATLDEHVVLETIADKLSLLVEYDALSVDKVDEETNELYTILVRDDWAAEIESFRIKIGEGLTGWVAAHNEALLCNDALKDSRTVQVPGTPDEEQATIAVPLSVLDKVIGVLCVDRLGGRTFSEDEFALVKLFASLAAVAVENASLYEQSRQRAITDSLTGLHNHGHFQEAIAREVKRCQRYGDVFALLMIDLDRFKQVNDRFGHPLGDRVLRRVARALRECSRETDYVARYGGEEFTVLLPRASSEEARTLAERIRERIRAVRVAGGKDFHVSASIGIADFPACGGEASHVISAADTALLLAKRRGRNCEVYYGDVRGLVSSATVEATALEAAGIESLAAAVDAKASFREGHCDAVSQMARVLARDAGLEPEKQEELAVAARLHDLGLIVVPVEVLEKRGPLDAGEWREVQRHCAVAADILAGVGAPESLCRAVLHHHEHWDGSGYPGGLAGEAIPVEARILALCDAYQAMVSPRPYRAAMAPQEAIDELRRQSGSQFAPDLVARFAAGAYCAR